MATAPDTDELLDLAASGDPSGVQRLMERHRARLKRMVRVRLDPRFAGRVDPSDVVQEALAEAWKQLGPYLRDRPLPFYPWLRQLAWKRLVDLHRHHIQARKRSVLREERITMSLPDRSASELAKKLVAGGPSPSQLAMRKELREEVQRVLARLSETDREVLVLRQLEQLSTRETAAVLGITEGAVKVRHLRALNRFRKLMAGGSSS